MRREWKIKDIGEKVELSEGIKKKNEALENIERKSKHEGVFSEGPRLSREEKYELRMVKLIYNSIHNETWRDTYAQPVMHIMDQLLPNDERVLVLGAGTPVRFPKRNYEIVDLDERIGDLWKQVHPNAEIHIEDMFEFIERAKKEGKKWKTIVLPAILSWVNEIKEVDLEKLFKDLREIVDENGSVFVYDTTIRRDVYVEMGNYESKKGFFVSEGEPKREVVELSHLKPTSEKIVESANKVGFNTHGPYTITRWIEKWGKPTHRMGIPDPGVIWDVELIVLGKLNPEKEKMLKELTPKDEYAINFVPLSIYEIGSVEKIHFDSNGVYVVEKIDEKEMKKIEEEGWIAEKFENVYVVYPKRVAWMRDKIIDALREGSQ